MYLIIRYFDLRYGPHTTTKENGNNRVLIRLQTLTTKSISLLEIYQLYATMIDPICNTYFHFVWRVPYYFHQRWVYLQMGKGFKTYDALTIGQQKVYQNITPMKPTKIVLSCNSKLLLYNNCFTSCFAHMRWSSLL